MNHVSLNHVLMARRINVLATTLLVLGSVLSIALFLYSNQLSSEIELIKIGIQQRSEATSKPRLSRPLLLSNTKAAVVKND